MRRQSVVDNMEAAGNTDIEFEYFLCCSDFVGAEARCSQRKEQCGTASVEAIPLQKGRDSARDSGIEFRERAAAASVPVQGICEAVARNRGGDKTVSESQI